MPEHIREPLAAVRRAYPNGVEGAARTALLVALADEMSELSIGTLMRAGQGEEPVVTQNDLATALSISE